jgi:hypothetical protein
VSLIAKVKINIESKNFDAVFEKEIIVKQLCAFTFTSGKNIQKKSI